MTSLGDFDFDFDYLLRLFLDDLRFLFANLRVFDFKLFFFRNYFGELDPMELKSFTEGLLYFLAFLLPFLELVVDFLDFTELRDFRLDFEFDRFCDFFEDAGDFLFLFTK